MCGVWAGQGVCDAGVDACGECGGVRDDFGMPGLLGEDVAEVHEGGKLEMAKKAKPCPGSGNRSKGGRKLGIGKGKGPIGRRKPK